MIRPFCNVDLPRLVDVWIQHWSCIGISPPVSMATIEQAILARTFFDPNNLIVAESEGEVRAWCHFAVDGTGSEKAGSEKAGRIRSICFSPDGGLDVCDSLLTAVERAIGSLGAEIVTVGLVRDGHDGYAGLPPIGHGIGIPAADSRTSSLLSRRSYNRDHSISRMVVNTSPYRPPVSRDALQLRRTTRIESHRRIPTEPRLASAMSHFDIERHQTIDHRTDEILSMIEFWSSDVEAQVMNCDNAILDLSLLKQPDQLSIAESYLIGSVIQRMADRRVYTVETAVDSSQQTLIRQLEALQFRNFEQGYQWTKKVPLDEKP
ncbi:hypothetical protein Poly41_18700 [Novipirellula artificiosorum]|uniref:N-acetyltransferase domain-containing protein n=2 Tax=Novipirellula artificiosorum TaxID=2528016 RepID=A0A5C6DXB1_9BACT|nr:hypothetical protein Poly41_18700 [Novipirellula artificiosorum]